MVTGLVENLTEITIDPKTLIRNALVLTEGIKNEQPCYYASDILGWLMKWSVPTMHTLKMNLKAVLIREDTILEQLRVVFDQIRGSPEWKNFANMAGLSHPAFTGSPAHCAALFLMHVRNLSSSLLSDPSYSEALEMSGSETQGAVFQSIRDRYAGAILEYQINGVERYLTLTHDGAWAMMEMMMVGTEKLGDSSASRHEQVFQALRSGALRPMV